LFVLQQVDNVDVGENQCKIVQFTIFFYVLENGQPMVEYEYLKPLFEFLKVKNLPKKHWTNASRWVMGGTYSLPCFESFKR
jgi:hypothetical protein